METKYWRSLEERNDPATFRKSEIRAEYEHKKSVIKGENGSSRRDFLKAFGFTIGGTALLASCNRPVEKAIPYLIKPEEVTPGMANYYASTFYEGNEYCSILVKVRDGRPIKIEGNDLSPVSRKGTSARVQASVLNLYDDARYKGPLKDKEPVTWEILDKEVIESLDQLNTENRKVVLLTPTVISPAFREVIAGLLATYPNIEWVKYDPVPVSGILTANSESFGSEIIPDYHFDKANIIVSFNADFLGTWLSPVEYTKKYSSGRDLTTGRRMSRHYQLEAHMSVTGANADIRIPMKPSQESAALADLYHELLRLSGSTAESGKSGIDELSSVASDLWANKGLGIVVSGSNRKENQLIVNAINEMLGNHGSTITFDRPLLTRQSTVAPMERFIGELTNGSLGGVILYDVNPVYDHPKGSQIAGALKNLSLSVSMSDRPDETTTLCRYNATGTHFLESWGDAEPKAGFYSLTQPVIQPLFDGRQPEESLLRWSRNSIAYYDYLKEFWRAELFPQQTQFSEFNAFWNDSLQKGVFEGQALSSLPAYNDLNLNEALQSVGKPSDGWELILYETIALGNGKFANNPWLQELPDPMAKISWDNFVSVPVEWADANGVENESVIVVNGIEMPVFVQPGQADQTMAVALGYGRTEAGKTGNNIGFNVFPLVQASSEDRQFWLPGVTVETTTKTYPLALSQTHHSMEGRPIARESTFAEWQLNPSAGNEIREDHIKHSTTLYEKPDYPGHHWGLAIDLNACTGCGNCTISCQVENNIPVIGKEQVRNRRIMHWIRIDRYYSGKPQNPYVSFQPVMCQQCDNAPCENVCPVAATPHSDEGLNQMAYNRCVGTRYCLNNCPYRVRRFNWLKFVKSDKFDYHTNSDLGRMVLNPDVTVRSRGVVEKCTFCVQRIQDKKQTAKIEGRPLQDGEIEPACVQSCPSSALVFGDMNDKTSQVFRLIGKTTDPEIPGDPRNYHLLEELHTLPSVGYLTKIRNTNT